MIAVTNCGHDSRHQTKFCMLRKTGVPNYILLLVKTKAFFEFNGRLAATNPNMAILFDRNTYTHYESAGNFYNDDWIHFDFVGEEPFLDSLKIPFNSPIYLPQINSLSNYVRLLVKENHSDTLHKEQVQDSLMRILLYRLDSQIASPLTEGGGSKYYPVMNQLRMNIHNTPHQNWTVDTMAESIHISPSYFQHLYKEFFHLSCMQEVILARIERAKFYLSTTDTPIKVLSDLCGYENELHFIRQFKQKEGLTPTQYRQLYKAAR
ncbi:AraC family transcriptional regulator, arabinose operon regulatory protein [Anaerocolumna jejuensis DSM 15929]|uniref:AraC family transcriptional regulator, arabinose operon regulatory protein n=1 Tax=Anaerocolumna jejuensis DSM 15929 TaxID=1121322 RepID=A0A1M7CQN5_9FIRM|nr:AraC family transcriptional regulator, arabinose operon regulatory protein [Anaerocolumna jejuensis DSM 15929]